MYDCACTGFPIAKAAIEHINNALYLKNIIYDEFYNDKYE